MGSKEWDIDLVRDVLNTRDQNCVLNTPLEETSREDTIYWSMEHSGVYSVRSAYKMLQAQKGAWHLEDNNSIWHTIWCIKAPPRALNLVWRALANCLPTKTELQQKHVNIQAWCPVCANGVESILHGLVTCPFASQCWQTLKASIRCEEVADFRSWLTDVLSSGNKDHQAEIVTLCWAIWRARNDLVWNQKHSTVNKVVAAAKQYLTQWKAAQGRSSKALLQPSFEGDGAITWAKPQPNTIKVSVDAAIFEDRDAVGFGIIARDSEGLLIQATTKIHQGLVTPVMAEAMAIKEALSWIDRMNWSSVSLESDCLVVLQAIRSKTPMRSPFGVIIQECRRHIQQLNKISLYFVKRSANMAAHTLARESYIHSDRMFDRVSLPVEVKICIATDLIC